MIRIIGGELKGRRISAPASLPVRPTTDFAKEGLFNVLNNRFGFEEISALDLFSGTGNISFELASRGCRDITSVDGDIRCVNYISKTARELHFSQIHTVKADSYVFLARARRTWDLIFADPPYAQKQAAEIPGLVFSHALLNTNGILIVEHEERFVFPDTSKLLERRRYGKVNFSIFGETN
ncbi:MAG TPA: RsmD family RNA methyltransferase [Bacteroidia bacterium]|nr:RsmD family RNA methyltransferase [Bacteroidia bacterium]